jgi:N-acetylmuramoyl-L-alanine amidase
VTTFKRLTSALAALLSGAAGGACAQGPVSGLPAVPAVHGALQIQVAYPAAGSSISAGDSTFLFGSVGDGRATLTIAGQPVTVAPNGAWLAWIAIPRDSSFVLHLVARHGSDSATAALTLVRAGWVRTTGAWIDRASLSPVGDVWMPAGEALPLAVHAAPRATVRLILPDRQVIRFAADSIAGPAAEGIRNFDRDERNLARPASGDRYVATLRGALNPSKGGLEPAAAGAPPIRPAMLEVTLKGVTTRIPWPLSVTRSPSGPLSIVLDDDPQHLGGTDRVTIGRAYPGGTYTWFLPQGTRTRADMRMGDQVRLRLSRDAIAWVPLIDVHPAAASDDARPAIMGSPTLTAEKERTRLRIPLTRPIPLSVDETERGLHINLFDAVSNGNFTRYGAQQRFVRLLTWKQAAADRLMLAVTFDRPLWGWRVRIEGTDLVFDFREPPAIDSTRPLAGRRIVIDPGHPPIGACGPTRLCEPEANLAIAKLVRDQLEAAGATVIMTRTANVPVELWPRVALADSVDAELLVSIHNNALPDGVNPFTNNGTTTFFNHPQSIALARAVQAHLVANLGLRDLGVARADFALARPTWYPAILTEGLYLMVPEQEAALRVPEGQRRYATGVVAGITEFLRGAFRR